MGALAISAASFLGLFFGLFMGWDALVARRDHGRRLLARMGVKGAEQAATAASAVNLSVRRAFTAFLSGRASPQAEWAERWVGPATVAGTLAGGFSVFCLLHACRSPSAAWGTTVGAVAGGGFGWMLCRRWQRQVRAQDISHGLIDLLDLWILCLDAGMGFQAALARAAQDSELARPALRRELQLTHQEIMAGCPAEDALRRLARRCRGTAELSGLVSHIIQSEKLGGSIAKTLQVYANTLRFNRYQDTKEAVQKMPAKLAFPLIFCILPCLLIVIAGPAFLRLLEVLGRQ